MWSIRGKNASESVQARLQLLSYELEAIGQELDRSDMQTLSKQLFRVCME